MTRAVALVADLHGNWPATRAVADDIRARGIDTIWCLGDVVASVGSWLRQCRYADFDSPRP